MARPGRGAGGGPPPGPEFGELVRRELHAAADQVEPLGDGLERIRARVRPGMAYASAGQPGAAIIPWSPANLAGYGFLADMARRWSDLVRRWSDLVRRWSDLVRRWYGKRFGRGTPPTWGVPSARGAAPGPGYARRAPRQARDWRETLLRPAFAVGIAVFAVGVVLASVPPLRQALSSTVHSVLFDPGSRGGGGTDGGGTPVASSAGGGLSPSTIPSGRADATPPACQSPSPAASHAAAKPGPSSNPPMTATSPPTSPATGSVSSPAAGSVSTPAGSPSSGTSASASASPGAGRSGTAIASASSPPHSSASSTATPIPCGSPTAKPTSTATSSGTKTTQSPSAGPSPSAVTSPPASPSSTPTGQGGDLAPANSTSSSAAP